MQFTLPAIRRKVQFCLIFYNFPDTIAAKSRRYNRYLSRGTPAQQKTRNFIIGASFPCTTQPLMFSLIILTQSDTTYYFFNLRNDLIKRVSYVHFFKQKSKHDSSLDPKMQQVNCLRNQLMYIDPCVFISPFINLFLKLI